MRILLLPILTVALAQSAVATTLLEAYEQAKISDPIVKKALADSRQVAEKKEQAKSALLPQINAVAGANSSRYIDHSSDNQPYNNSFGQNRVYSIGLNLSQTLYNMQQWRALSLQEKAAQQAEVSFQAVQQNLLYRVAQAYISILVSLENLDLVRSEKKAVQTQLQNTDQQYKVGLVAVTDINQAQAQYDSVIASEIAAKNEVDNSIESLYEITGQYPNQLSKLNTKQFKTQRFNDANVYIQQGEQQNLTLVYYKMAKELSKEGIKVAESTYLPTVNLVANVNRTNTQMPRAMATSGIADRTLDQATIGVEVSMPLYTGGRNSSQVREQKYAFISSSENLESAYRNLVKSIRSVINGLEATKSAIKAYQQYVVSANSAYNAASAGYNAGTHTISDVLTSTRNVHDAKRQLSKARYDYLLLELQLKQLTGTLNQDDLIYLDSLLNVSTKIN